MATSFGRRNTSSRTSLLPTIHRCLDCFTTSFQRKTCSVQNLPGEVAGKSSNTQWAFREAGDRPIFEEEPKSFFFSTVVLILQLLIIIITIIIIRRAMIVADERKIIGRHCVAMGLPCPKGICLLALTETSTAWLDERSGPVYFSRWLTRTHCHQAAVRSS